jgi:HSP20 family protein
MTPKSQPTTKEIAVPERTDIFRDMDRMFREFHDAWFWNLQNPWTRREPPASGGYRFPARTDIIDRGSHYEVVTELPGVSKEQIDVRVVGNVLSVETHEQVETEEKTANYLRRERSSTGYWRQVELPEPLGPEEVKARYDNGVLTLTVPKRHPAVEKKVPVE